MTRPPLLSLVIAVYNNPSALRYIFEALRRQTFSSFDVLIADDGSGGETARIVNEAKRVMPYGIRHLWHADRGWRKNTMLNDAIRESRTDYLVFFDGDCIPSRYYVEDHFVHREKGKILLGRRVEHGRRWAETLSMDSVSSGAFERYTVADLWDALRGASVRLEHGIRITHPKLRSFVEKRSAMLGSNFSTFKEHLVAVNGFDESYDGPGFGEDTDIFYRLSLIGVEGKSLRNLAVQYHLWHPQTVVGDINRRRFASVQQRQQPRCIRGLHIRR